MAIVGGGIAGGNTGFKPGRCSVRGNDVRHVIAKVLGSFDIGRDQIAGFVDDVTNDDGVEVFPVIPCKSPEVSLLVVVREVSEARLQREEVFVCLSPMTIGFISPSGE